jgi:membrane-bound ClpP family serine protease
MKDISKLSIQLWMAVVLTIFGIVLIVASFIVPPLGVIDSSVLVAYGETLTFVGALVGVDYSYKYKVKKRDLDQ